MAGSPKLRAKRDAAVTAALREAGLPQLVPTLPPGWNRLHPVQKLQILYDESLDVCMLDLRYRGEDAALINARNQARAVVLGLAQRWALQDKREEERKKAVEELEKVLDQKDGGTDDRPA